MRYFFSLMLVSPWSCSNSIRNWQLWLQRFVFHSLYNCKYFLGCLHTSISFKKKLLSAGTNCGIQSTACLSHPCLNGGTCHNVGSTFVCACPANYTGVQCESGLPPCYFEPCQNGARCIDQSDTHYICFCPPGFKSATCDTETTACDSSPCLNGGTCQLSGNGFICTCPSEYGGKCDYSDFSVFGVLILIIPKCCDDV